MIETPRLLGRPLLASDFETIHHQLHSNPQVMATLSPHGDVFSEVESHTFFEALLAQWEEHGLGYWLFTERESQAFVGHGGVRWVLLDGILELEIGYAIVAERWRQGYASEIAKASVSYGFEMLQVPSIVSFTLPHNKASRRVMEKTGFVYEREFVYKGLLHVLYRLTSEQFRGMPDPAKLDTIGL